MLYRAQGDGACAVHVGGRLRRWLPRLGVAMMILGGVSLLIHGQFILAVFLSLLLSDPQAISKNPDAQRWGYLLMIGFGGAMVPTAGFGALSVYAGRRLVASRGRTLAIWALCLSTLPSATCIVPSFIPFWMVQLIVTILGLIVLLSRDVRAAEEQEAAS